MSENEEIMNETENETMAAEVEAVENVETEAAEVEAAERGFRRGGGQRLSEGRR